MPTPQDIALPKLPEPWTAASTLKCTACGAPYEPMRSLTPMASAALLSGTPLYHGCKCGCAQFEGTFGYDSPSPAQFTADQMNAHYLLGVEDARAAASGQAGWEAFVTKDMVTAYLKANDAYWSEMDSVPTAADKWRNGSPHEATRVSLIAALAASPSALEGSPVETEYSRIGLLEWAVERWRSSVQNRPMVNIHRRTMDDCWRSVMRYAGGDPDTLVGPSHDEILARRANNASPEVAGEAGEQP